MHLQQPVIIHLGIYNNLRKLNFITDMKSNYKEIENNC